ncbi:MAG: aspartate aminotransferase family protein [Cellvibrionaceae bacterium]|nr:aspartate aminotransferase family protein [Cellvibrionaceae bacterium]MCV6626079.1 aspartate aminotransferase family protein [Cellvibrionaceae bacterium]
MNTQYLMNNYGTRQHTLVKGEGCYLFDRQGRRYLDALSGIAVCGLGHNYAPLTQAISEQAATLLHISNLFNIEHQARLAEQLCQISGMEKAYFGNSGAEANEAAIKIARKVGHQRGIDKAQIIVAQNSFHGRTLATLSATGNPKVQAGFEPLVEGFVHVPFDDIEAIKAAAGPNVVAVLLEPIQGEGGVNVPAADYLEQVGQLCQQHNWLLMLDEIQTGNGRSGEYFAFQHGNAKPDVITTAKGLGNGLPIGACLAKGEAAEALQAGNHGSTYGGNPLVCAGANVVVEAISQGDILANCRARGEQLRSGIAKATEGSALVRQIRGQGLITGIELTQDCGELVEAAWQAGLILNVTAGNTVRLLPPLIIDSEQTEQLIATVAKLILGLSQ